MNIITNYSDNKFKENSSNAQTPEKKEVVKLDYKPDLIDICSDKIISNHDIRDTVTMPRAIFKGYLCFTAGTAINAIAGVIKNDKTKGALQIVGSIISIIGTFNFVKPFLANNRVQKLTENKK